ncbi:MAG: glycerophosphodiester phosphodiesterase family protein [Pseudomonadota bacterium]
MLPAAFLDTPIAHRGLHDREDGRPENSMEAFQAAVDNGYGIELDLQLTADSRALVFHDYDLARLTGAEGLLRDRASEDMGDLPLIGGATGAPLLEDVLALVQGRVPLLIELKDQDGALGDNVGLLETATIKALEGYAGPVAVMSFNPHAVAVLQSLAPDILRGLVTEEFDPGVWKIDAAYAAALNTFADYDRVGASFTSHNHKHLSMPHIAELRAAGASVLCWTIRSPEQEAAARRVADNVTFEGYLPAVAS